MRGPHEQRGRLQLGQAREQARAPERRLEVDRARAGPEGDPRAGRAVDALELVDRDVGHARVDLVGVGEHRPELLLDAPASQRVRQQRQLRAQQPHERLQPRPHEGQRRAQQPEPADALGMREADLEGDAAAHRVAHQVGALDLQRVHHAEHGAGGERRAVAGERGLARAAEARQVEGVDAIAAAERRGGVEERRLGAAEAVQQQDVGALAHGQRRDLQAAVDLDVVDAQQRRAAARQPEQALEADGQVEIAARVEPALRERLDARELAGAQAQPGLGVGADRDVGAPAGDAGPHAGAVGRAAHLPRAADVGEADVVGGVEARLGAQIALRQGAERALQL